MLFTACDEYVVYQSHGFRLNWSFRPMCRCEAEPFLWPLFRLNFGIMYISPCRKLRLIWDTGNMYRSFVSNKYQQTNCWAYSFTCWFVVIVMVLWFYGSGSWRFCFDKILWCVYVHLSAVCQPCAIWSFNLRAPRCVCTMIFNLNTKHFKSAHY